MERFEKNYIIFFDGDCGVCNFWVQWILKRDQKKQFMFASLQSDFGQKFLGERKLNQKEFNTIYLWKEGAYYVTRSKAILKVFSVLGGLYSFISFVGNLFPAFFTDAVYDLISRNRMKISSRKCLLPSAEEKKRFIDV